MTAEAVSASRAFDVPERFSTGNDWAILSVCERFGLAPSQLKQERREDVAAMVAYDRLRCCLESRAASTP